MILDFDASPFITRCQRILESLPNASVLILQAAPEVTRNRDTHFPYRQESSFYYLTGFEEPDAFFILVKDQEGASQRHLLCRPKHEERELWEGFRWGPDAAKEVFGFDQSASSETFDDYLKPLLESTRHLYTDLSISQRLPGFDTLLQRLRRAGHALQWSDALPVIESLRRRKEPYEISLMRRAANISAEAHREAMRAARPGRYEYEMEAALSHTFLRYGSRAVAYPSIVASGANACILHYRDNRSMLQDGDLLLIDAGCEYSYYASDITRTFPVNGYFNTAQRDLYSLVLTAQETAIAALKPGMTWEEYQQLTLRTVVEGLKALELCEGTVESIIESGDYKRFYMHRAGHWLGLDVHDAGAYVNETGASIPLTPGMVLTVEPGCYVRPDERVPSAFWNTGIRIEDDVLITETGCEVLSHAVPKSIEAIEALMQK